MVESRKEAEAWRQVFAEAMSGKRALIESWGGKSEMMMMMTKVEPPNGNVEDVAILRRYNCQRIILQTETL